MPATSGFYFRVVDRRFIIARPHFPIVRLFGHPPVGIRFETSFAVPASIEDAWKVLLDAPRVLPCMPGAELTQMLDPHRFQATARLRVGPVELLFKGEGELHDLDPAARTAKLRARGSDTKGRGTFQTEMAFSLTAQSPETIVRVATDLTLSGSVAQHARGAGLVKEMAQQLTGRFAKNLAAVIVAEGAPASSSKQPIGAAPKRAPAISGLSLLLAAIKATLRRWLGDRP
jgi:carbon monoxide dehydrogenase subunit G